MVLSVNIPGKDKVKLPESMFHQVSTFVEEFNEFLLTENSFRLKKKKKIKKLKFVQRARLLFDSSHPSCDYHSGVLPPDIK